MIIALLSSLSSFSFYIFRILNASLLSLGLSASTLTKSGKGKVFLVYATKAYRDSRSIAPFTFNLGTR